MKKKRIAIIIAAFTALTIALTGCGMGMNGASKEMANDAIADVGAVNENAAAGEYYDEGGEECYEDEEADYDAAEAEYEEDGEMDGSETEADVSGAGKAGKINSDMLVYRCNIIVDTLDFDKSVEDLNKLIEKNGGFIESETYSDGHEYYGYYIDESEKDNTYSATIRVPSKKYGKFVDGMEALGDIKSKNASTENISVEYGTAKSTLEIYEKERASYIKMLENTKKESVMLEIQEKIFDLDIEIADIKTRMAAMETDVAYSYVNVEINEVTRYATESTSTFGERLKEAGEDSVAYFVSFVQGIFLFLVHAFWYIIIIAVVIYVVYRICKARRSPDFRQKAEAKGGEIREKNAKINNDQDKRN